LCPSTYHFGHREIDYSTIASGLKGTDKLSLMWQHGNQTKALQMELSLLLETGFYLSAWDSSCQLDLVGLVTGPRMLGS
jgi:hypothetical protein